ncbi:fascin domain-containing protein [Bacillus mycoides]|uniref:fascin domain-containing protein n=1 Tax=Bacillus mycoides TaxID=1405 RepID=UPI003D25F8F5
MKRFITYANGNTIFKKLVLMVLPMVLIILMITPSNDVLAANQSNVGSLKGVNLFNGSWTVAIQAANVQYVSAEPSGNVIANRNAVNEWEKFELIPTGELYTYALKAKSNGKYVSFEPNGRVVADRTSIGAWEKFILYNGGDNRIYVLQALSNGRFISANGGRELTANSYVAGSWERFVIVYL